MVDFATPNNCSRRQNYSRTGCRQRPFPGKSESILIRDEDPDRRKEYQEALETTLGSIPDDEHVESIWRKVTVFLVQPSINTVYKEKKLV